MRPTDTLRTKSPAGAHWLWVVGASVVIGCHAAPPRRQAVAPSPSVASAKVSAQTLVVLPGDPAANDRLTPPREESPSPAEDQAIPLQELPPWTLTALEESSLARHPALAEQQARIEALRGKWLQAGLRPNPEVGFSGQQLFTDGQVEQIGFYANQTIVRQPKLDWDQSVVCREIEVAECRLAEVRQRVLTEVRLAFFDLLIAQRRQVVLAELAAIADRNLTTARTLQSAGEASQVDVLRAQVEAQMAQVELNNAANDRKACWSRLAVLIGEPALPLQAVEGALDAPWPGCDSAALAAQIAAENPQLLAALADQDRAHAATHRALVEALPNVNVQAIVHRDNAWGGTNSNLQISFPLPWRDRNQGGIQQARCEEVAAAYAVERTHQTIQQQLATAVQRYENAATQVQEYAAPEGILARAQESLSAIERGYRAGEIGYLDLLTAQRVYSQTHLLYLDALRNLWSSHTELIGLTNRGQVSFPAE